MNQWILNERYQLQKRLCQKGARHTFIAKDLETDQLVVVKVLLFGPGFQWQDHKLFERGAAALKDLSFPGIPQYLDYFDVDIGHHQGFAQVQTYIPARSLQGHIQAGRTFSEDDILQIALQLLKILHYLHQRQPAIIHRDIKPSNILLDNRTGNSVGQVYLVDFDSIQSSATRSDQTMTIVGTYGYMPPEQFGGKARPASDLYSLGATLIYAATSQHPADLPQRDMRIAFEDQVSLSDNLVDWLTSMTHPDLDYRLQSAIQAAKALKDAIQNPKRQLPVKPPKSKILVVQTQSPDTLEIIIPPKGFDSETLWSLVTISVPMGLFTVVLGARFWPFSTDGFSLKELFSLVPVFLILLPPVWVVFRMMLELPLLLSQRVQLRIDPHTIYETHTFLRRRYRSVPRANMRLVSEANHVCLHTSTGSFSLPIANAAERKWLAQILSQWLQIPIQREYGTNVSKT